MLEKMESVAFDRCIEEPAGQERGLHRDEDGHGGEREVEPGGQVSLALAPDDEPTGADEV